MAQNAQRAEIKALLHLVVAAERPTHVRVDNRAVAAGVARSLAGATTPEGPLADTRLHTHRAALAKHGT